MQQAKERMDAKSYGAKGGNIRAAKLSPERRKEIAAIASAVRWGGRPAKKNAAKLIRWVYEENREKWNSPPPPTPLVVVDTILKAFE